MQLHPAQQWRVNRDRMRRRLVAHARPTATASPCQVYRLGDPATAHRTADFRGSGTSVAFPSVASAVHCERVIALAETRRQRL